MVVSLAVHPECADLACSVKEAKAEEERLSTGRVYNRMFVRHWDTWNDGTQNHLFVQDIGADGHATGDAVWVTRGFDGDNPSKPFGDESEFTFAPDGQRIDTSASAPLLLIGPHRTRARKLYRARFTLDGALHDGPYATGFNSMRAAKAAVQRFFPGQNVAGLSAVPDAEADAFRAYNEGY